MSGEENDQQPEMPQLNPETMARMQRPLDASIPYYAIPTQAILQMYQAIDEIPMKYARVLLPMIQANIDPLPKTFKLPKVKKK